MADFKEKISKNEFVEYEEVYPGKYYGTMRSEVERIWQKQKHVLFDIDVYGAMSIKRKYPEQSLSILVMPPSLDVLKERLIERSTESEDAISTRLAKAERELGFKEKFDYLLLNDDLKKAIDEPSGENLGFPSVLPLVNSLGAESESFISLIQRELFNFSDLMSGLETPYTARFPSGEMDTPVGFASS